MELCLANYFNKRTNLIIPNVFWSFFDYEMDLLVLTPANRGYEIEIKISKSDLKRDHLKRHNHNDHRIKYLYFAISENLNNSECLKMIPEKAGIIVVFRNNHGDLRCKTIRKPQKKYDYIFKNSERMDLFRLAALRLWPLKRKLLKNN